jgi:hypothetical protein
MSWAQMKPGFRCRVKISFDTQLSLLLNSTANAMSIARMITPQTH